jgi:hypothetical protein
MPQRRNCHHYRRLDQVKVLQHLSQLYVRGSSWGLGGHM